jgi:hypothetical protein
LAAGRISPLPQQRLYLNGKPPPARDVFGPWAAGDPIERRAQFRSLATATALLIGSTSTLVEALRRAETDPTAGDLALQQFELLPALTKRKILSTWGVINLSKGAPMTFAKILRAPLTYICRDKDGGWFVVRKSHAWLFGSREEALFEKNWLDANARGPPRTWASGVPLERVLNNSKTPTTW